MNTLAKKTFLTSLKQSFSQGVRYLHSVLIEPRSENEDTRRREFIFNVIVTTMIAVLVVLGGSIVVSEIRAPEYSGVSFIFFSFFVAFFASLLALSRRGHAEIAAYLFIGLYYFGATYGIYAWGTELPVSALSYAVIIVMSSVLISTRFGFAATAVICATVVTLGLLDLLGIVPADRSWRLEEAAFKGTVEHSFVYLSIMVVSWLSNREIEKSLKRARRSELALKAERDLLEQKVEERTRELKAVQLDKVSQLYRFAEFGRLASGLFHDLINPLTAVSLTVEKLKESGELSSDEARENVDKAIRASRRMESFMQTVRKQLKSEGGSSVVSLRSELSDAADLLSHKAKKAGVSIFFDASEEATVTGDPIRFFQVAVNLISNAIDSYNGRAPEEGEDRSVRIKAWRKDGDVILSVSDAGCGIPVPLLSLIFEPFFTTKTDHDGIGIGLSTTKRIVEKDFKGAISIKSSVGKGSEFIITIPAYAQSESKHSKSDKRSRGAAVGKRELPQQIID